MCIYLIQSSDLPLNARMLFYRQKSIYVFIHVFIQEMFIECLNNCGVRKRVKNPKKTCMARMLIKIEVKCSWWGTSYIIACKIIKAPQFFHQDRPK